MRNITPHRHREYAKKYSITKKDILAHKFPSAINKTQLYSLITQICSYKSDKINFDNGGYAKKISIFSDKEIFKIEGFTINLLPEIVKNYEIYWRNELNEKEGLEIILLSERNSINYLSFVVNFTIIGKHVGNDGEIVDGKLNHRAVYLSKKLPEEMEVLALIKDEIEEIMIINDYFWIEQDLYKDNNEYNASTSHSKILERYGNL
jgi:hypothetical protein